MAVHRKEHFIKESLANIESAIADESEEELEDIALDLSKKEEQYVESFEVPKIFWNWERIKDWDKRTKNYTQQQKEFYKFMAPKFQELKDVTTSPGWTVLDERDGVKVETKISSRNLLLMRANCEFDYPPCDLYRFLHCFAMRLKWDKNI